MLIPNSALRRGSRSHLFRFSIHRHIRRDMAYSTLAVPSRDLPIGDSRKG